jgi:uncharacterized membrane protein (DUF4010 family)
MAAIETAVPLLVSTLSGAAVGLERQRSGHADGDDAHFAGLRTFTLIGLFGGLAGQMTVAGLLWPATFLLAAAAALIAAAYAAVSRRDIDATTEVAALVVLAAGVMAGRGELALASGVTAFTVLLLVEKTRLHSLARLLDNRGFVAGARFAVLALVILPLLPEGPLERLGGIRPRALWALVLFFSGLSFAGYVARALIGDRYGYPMAGLFGGLVSSTSVTLTYSRLSRDTGYGAMPLASGVIAASAVQFIRVAVAVAVLNPAMLGHLVPPLIAPLVSGAVIAWLLVRHDTSTPGASSPPDNPLQLGAALQMVVAFQVVLVLLDIIGRWFGETGLLASAAVLGLTDVDALTASMTQKVAGGLDVPTGALAIVVGILSNSATKLGIVAVVGRGRFRLAAGASLVLMTVAGLVSLVWL